MSEMPMVERVAKALYEANGFKRKWDHPHLNKAWRPQYLKQARAAILAMREPSEEMKKAGADQHTSEGRCATDYGYEADSGDIGNSYRAMIDAALSERLEP